MSCLSNVFIYFWLMCYVECSFEPLKLTPLIKSGKFKEALELSKVNPDMNGRESYSGFVTTHEACGNHLFFWFHLARSDWQTAPVLLWLQGGPGCSSLIGMFEEIGPFYFKDSQLVTNQYSWTNNNNVIFLDQPVGTGFSFTERGCYAENITVIGEEVYGFLIQFFELFPTLKHNRFFLTGESFAGHYIPVIASEIHNRNLKATSKINMVGCLIGGPSIDIRCEKTATFMYENGVLDAKGRDKMKKMDEENRKAVDDQNYLEAATIVETKYKNVILPLIPSVQNILYDKNLSFHFDFEKFLARHDVREQIHVGNSSYNVCSIIPYNHLRAAGEMSVGSFIEELLNTNNYSIGFYNGLLDLNVPSTSTECVLQSLHWNGSETYLRANRTAWYSNRRLAGWFKVAGSLYRVTVRGGGHLTPSDQPEAMLDLITAVVNSQPGQAPLSTLKTSNK